MKIVTISDTHSMHRQLTIPDGDVLIHSGDFLGNGRLSQLEEFCTWLKELPHKHKIVVAGNHDTCLEHLATRDRAIETIKGVATYLEDSSVVIDGIKFYGSPWQPYFYNWAFNLPRGNIIKKKWDMIEEDTNVLITHGPPHTILDHCEDGHVGCEELYKATCRLSKLGNLKHHIFGHIHEGYGTETIRGTTYHNASNCTGKYEPINKVLTFNI